MISKMGKDPGIHGQEVLSEECDLRIVAGMLL